MKCPARGILIAGTRVSVPCSPSLRISLPSLSCDSYKGSARRLSLRRSAPCRRLEHPRAGFTVIVLYVLVLKAP